MSSTGDVVVDTTATDITNSAVADTRAAGANAKAAAADHKHGREAFATPGSSAVGDSAAAGSAATVVHSDHRHGREGFAVPGSSAVGDAPAAGTATTVPHSDHVHGREAFATNALVLGTAAAPGVSASPMRSDDTIAVFDATTPATVGAGTAGAAGSAGAAAHRDHVHPVSTGIAAGHAGDVTLSTSVYTTVLTTASLAVGTWLLFASATISNGNATAGTVEMTAAVGTATATFDGAQSTEGELPALSGGTAQVLIAAKVVVTVAGTIIIQVKAPGTSASTAKGSTPTTSSVDATGYVALQVA